ncbi:VPLPA-CTERM sorting domain-containing protein [Thiocystis minor]|uniref:VPLPA-CTERM sorting domain-containing protein n=1 Tax=Thiocystis minor TaxID=61597 RepID=UPI0019126CAE|nr:VPLPA-CTERM sorting domain-containing protein [Thiocystis minor]
MNQQFLGTMGVMALLLGSFGAAQAGSFTCGGGDKPDICVSDSADFTPATISDTSNNVYGFDWSGVIQPTKTEKKITLNLTYELTGGVWERKLIKNKWKEVLTNDESWSVFVDGTLNDESKILKTTDDHNKTLTTSFTWTSGDALFAQLASSNKLSYWFTENTNLGDSFNLTSAKLSIECQPTTVPIPAAAPLFLGGLSLVGWAGRRRRQRSMAGA